MEIGHARQRVVLAALLVDVNRAVTVEQLMSRVWGEEPPQRARGTLHSYLSRLRSALAPGDTGTSPLTRRPGGYALNVDPLSVDLHRFRHLLARAREGGTADTRAASLIQEALGLWRGEEPFAGLDTPWLAGLRDSLAHERRTAELDLTDVRLRLGHHADLLTSLALRTTAHPLDERVAGQYVLALFRSGRRADALAHLRRVRRTLAEELGIDPSAELSALQQRILRAEEGAGGAAALPPGGAGEAGEAGDVRVATVRADTVRADTVHVDTVHVANLSVAEATPSVVRPAQLPTAVPDFTGRESLASELVGRLAAGVPVVAVAGIGGVGKTTLALHVAHASRGRFPDGQLYVDLHGAAELPADPGAVLGAFLRALGVTESSIPDETEERAALYRSLLAGRQVLVLLDNARDAAQVRPLLPGTAGCTALLTSRARLIGLEGASSVDLDVMSPEEGLSLFSRIVGEERASSSTAVEGVVAACGFLPLAIRIAASRLAARRGWSVEVLASKLADERRRLDELRVGDLGVTATFELGYGQLEEEQARAFRLLGLADGPDLSLAAAAALLDRDPRTAEDLLESLVDVSLLESMAPGRYRFHDLVRLFARSRAERDEQPRAERDAAVVRLLDFYLATTTSVFAIERPGERAVDHLMKVPRDGLAFGDREGALGWLFEEADCLLAAVVQAVGTGRFRHAGDLLFAAKDLGDSGVHSAQFERAAHAVREAARDSADASAEARSLNMLSHVQFVSGRFDQAERNLQDALPLAEACGDTLARSYALHNRSLLANVQGQFERAEEYHLLAIEAFRADRNLPSEASAYCTLAHVHVALGRTESAVDLARRGLRIYQDLGHRMRVANARNVLARALTQAGRIDEALEEFAVSLELFRETQQPLWEGTTHARLAETLLAADRPEDAVHHAERALALRAIGGEWMRAKTLTALGRGLHVLGERERARECWREALQVFEERGAKEVAEVSALLDGRGLT
ncbi:BTAD domain-containing putative transcriptional regulator [Streptomyces sp. NPDC048172]|uniref:AfsR/SARP family transcriptional regulator n=1 Tax=Streptomyces sp. NPDC048172 TaxID=3365505 RepID=UPI0037229E8B